jgi:hypothetical protein
MWQRMLIAGLMTVLLTPACLAQPDTEIPYKYVGNLSSLKFHRPWCPFAKVMSPTKMSLFHFRKDAIAQGFSPCRYCLPPFWTTVRAKILSPQTCNQDQGVEEAGSAREAAADQRIDTDSSILEKTGQP